MVSSETEHMKMALGKKYISNLIASEALLLTDFYKLKLPNHEYFSLARV